MLANSLVPSLNGLHKTVVSFVRRDSDIGSISHENFDTLSMTFPSSQQQWRVLGACESERTLKIDKL